MTLKEIFTDSLVDFAAGTSDVLDYVGLSVMTDGLKANRDTIIGLSGADSRGEIMFTILFNEGNPDVTEVYHGIPLDTFKNNSVSPEDGYAQFLEHLDGKYIATHSRKFASKFFTEFSIKHSLPPLGTTILGTEVLYKANRTPGTLLPALQDEGSLEQLMYSLELLSYPRSIKASLDYLYDQQECENKDYVNRLPKGVGNAFRVSEVYNRLLTAPFFGI